MVYSSFEGDSAAAPAVWLGRPAAASLLFELKVGGCIWTVYTA
ncbi:hypothetical protein QFZ34_001345 [Phyllobacterium ifriqiyense]|uniref:Uncharacterized protein n=1 Tax=Phyllobacterium ifriqiyense TaxID=314238 RepID=A0ABU0S5Z1_9HYPH|nr:hypothetical protein [Phyllobacterium ifriqiyense]MDQ0996168.1 hypothetical protein [Phyllobacterium ifriqiyense]